MTAPVPCVNLPETARWIAEESLLFADRDAPFHASVVAGDPKLMVIAGENVAGKSLFFQVLCSKVANAGPLPIRLSIRERTGAGASDMSGMRRVMMFGDEAEQSTGATSVQAVVTAFKNLDRPQGSILGLDEPELGLSDGYTRALGTYIGTEARNVPDVCAGVVVVTHSRNLAGALVDAYGAQPTFVHAGESSKTLEQWLSDPEHRSVEELLALPEIGLARFRETVRLLKK